MSDMIADAPVADSAPSSAPAPEAVADTPQPIRNEPIPAEPKEEPKEPKDDEPKKPVSTREALQKAREKVEKDSVEKPKPVEGKPADDAKPKEAAEKPVAEPAKPPEAPKAPEPAQKPSTPASDAPTRFSEAAKADWEKAPESVRAETRRALDELTKGHEKYKADATEFERIRPFHEAATRNGSNLHNVLTQVSAIEDAFERGPIAGMQKLADHYGFSLREMAADIMGQTPDQQSSAQEATIRELRQELAQIKQQVGSVTQTFQQQRQESVVKDVSAFAANHPRFDELSEDIAFFLQSGKTTDLAEAYALAERLNPAPVPPQEPAPAPAPSPAPTVQPDKGSKSITGAPTPGSNPAAKQPSSSIRDALKRAAAAAG